MKLLSVLFLLTAANLRDKLPAKRESLKSVRQISECFDPSGVPGNRDKCLLCAECELTTASTGEVVGDTKCASSPESTVSFYLREDEEIYCGNEITSVTLDGVWVYDITRAAYTVNSNVDIQSDLTLIAHSKISNLVCDKNNCNDAPVTDRAMLKSEFPTARANECYQCSARQICTSDNCRLKEDCFDGTTNVIKTTCPAFDHCRVFYAKIGTGSIYQHQVIRGCQSEISDGVLVLDNTGSEETVVSTFACSENNCNTNVLQDTPTTPIFGSFQLLTVSLTLFSTILI